MYHKLFYKFVVDTETIVYLHFELHAAQVALEAKSTSSPHQFFAAHERFIYAFSGDPAMRSHPQHFNKV